LRTWPIRNLHPKINIYAIHDIFSYMCAYTHNKTYVNISHICACIAHAFALALDAGAATAHRTLAVDAGAGRWMCIHAHARNTFT
jgi:hypothetical protein